MLFRKKIEGCCEYCKYAGQVSEEEMLCKLKGFVSPDDRCRRFRYDPLKRKPVRPPAKDFTRFDDEDFSL